MNEERSHANGNGNSFANGPAIPFRHNWEFQYLVIPSRVTIYDFP